MSKRQRRVRDQVRIQKVKSAKTLRRSRRTAAQPAAVAVVTAALALNGLVTQGAAAATHEAEPVINIGPGSQNGDPENLTTVGDTLFFTAYDGNELDLWASDGTASGTVAVTENLLAPYTYVSGLTAVGDTLFFSATNGDDGYELWSSDGTLAGTSMVKDIMPGDDEGSDPFDLVAVGGVLFFSASDEEHGRELWKSDGTAAGTVMVADLATQYAYAGAYPHDLTAVDGSVFFMADDGTYGMELWKTDGTSGGTVRLTDDLSGYLGMPPWNFTAVGDTLFFTTDAGGGVYDLWRSDGTAAGTEVIASLEDTYNGSSPRSLTAVGDTLFFVSGGEEGGPELWTSDGTTAGTAMIEDIYPGDYGSYPNSLTAMGGSLFFTATSEFDNGLELWESDGTAAGTDLITELSADDVWGGGSMVAAGDTLFLQAWDGAGEDQLWESDGTAAGTQFVAAFDDSLEFLTPVQDTLFFSGVNAAWGRELWKVTGVADTSPPDTTIDSGPAAGSTVTTSSVTFGFSGTPGDTAKLQCSLDGAAFADCTSPRTFTGLANGAHTVSFRAVDAAGNQDPTPASRSFTVAVPVTPPTPPGPTNPGPTNPGPTAPSNVFTVPAKGKADTKKGTLTVTLTLPGAGKLALAPSGKSPVKAVAVSSAGGATKVTITPSKAGMKKLKKSLKAAKKKGKKSASLKVTVAFTFTPTGGTANTKGASYKLTLK